MTDLHPTDLPAVLVVDDVEANLFALEAVLQPLGVELLSASSGADALDLLARHGSRIAVALLDVQMPAMDGFEVANHMLGDRKLARIPIMFMTAHDADRSLALRGYASGAVDYVAKPFHPDEFREKVRALLNIDAQRRVQQERAQQLLLDERRRGAQRLLRLEQAGVREYHRLANALPAIVWTTDASGAVDFCSNRFTQQLHVDADTLRQYGWEGVVHPDDLERWLESRDRAMLAQAPHVVECRLGSRATGYRLFQLRELPRVDDDGQLTGWVGSGLDIEVQREALANKVLADVGQVLEASLDWRTNLSLIPPIVVPSVADWCGITIGAPWDLRWSTAGPHVQPPPAFADPLSTGFLSVDEVMASGDPRFFPYLSDAGAPGFRSGVCVPIAEHGEVYGALMLLVEGSSRRLDLEDLEFAVRLAERFAAAVRVGDLYDQARAGADAALVLEVVGDGVALVDSGGIVRVWNAAAERITGLTGNALIGRPAEHAIPWWSELEPQVPIGNDEPATAVSLRAGTEQDDLWLSISGVDFGRGRAYAFRDASNLHRLERLQSDFVATVSHELRTPLASITGATDTLHRDDIQLTEEMRERLLDVIGQQSRRLAALVDDVLMVGRIGGASVLAEIEPIDGVGVAREVIEAAVLHLPDGTSIELVADDDLPRVMADGQMLLQVLTNLVDNAVKYSPDGGRVEVAFRPRVRTMRILVTDTGIGIASGDLEDIFSKFYRVDAAMSGGVSGTGLGLFIVRELVDRMGGSISVRSRLGDGTTFEVELPLAESVVEAREHDDDRVAHDVSRG